MQDRFHETIDFFSTGRELAARRNPSFKILFDPVLLIEANFIYATGVVVVVNLDD